MQSQRRKNNYAKYKALDPDYNRRRSYKNRYGITVEEYYEMVSMQDGKCAICLQTPNVLVVDHDHITGVVRGLLCSHCNTGIGLMRDSVVILESAIQYLGGRSQTG